MARASACRTTRSWLAALCCALALSPGELVLAAQGNKPPDPPVTEDKTPPPPSPGDKAPPAQTTTGAVTTPAKNEPGAEQPVKLTNDQLESLVAPIALYPDSLLAQVLVASTYPLELVQLQQWLAKNPKLKDKELADAVAKQPWDASIQSMAAIPDVVKRLSDDIQWTTDLGNAFLAQQADVMDAAQRMRKKAQDKGALKSNEQQKVTEQKEGDKTIIIVESANPEVVYVPSYSPTVVYGAPIYPYPPIYYPPYPPGAAFVSFSFGVMWGAAIWGGSCCGCGWHGGDVDINVNNNFNRNEINTGGGDRGQGGNRGQGSGGASAGTADRGASGGNRGGAGANNKAGGGGGQKWSHNPSHRGGAPYGDKATANKYGGNARGDSLQSRQNKAGGAGAASNRAGGAGGPSAGTRDASRGGSGGAGGDRIGNQSIGSGGSGSRGGSSGRGGGGFGSGGGYSGSGARANSSRGASSMGGRSFGGGGGGGRRR